MKVRVAASAVTAGLVAFGLSACVFITPQQTTADYTPSDGVSGRAGDIEIRNAFVVTDGAGTASVIAGLVNTSSADRSVQVQYTGSTGPTTATLLVPANTTLSLRTVPAASSPVETRPLLLEGVTAPAGSLLNVTIAQGSSSEPLRLPVLTGSLPAYATLVPTPTPTPTKTKKPRASDSPTAAPSDSASPGTTDGATDAATPTPLPSATP